MQEMNSERKPRLCVMTKDDGGYGFHLHGEKGKSGQFIRKVEAGSPAEAAGLRAGDRLVAVNGVNVERETHHQVVQRIKAVENRTRLLVVDPETHDALRCVRQTATEDMAVVGAGLSASAPSSPSQPAASVPPSPSEQPLNGSVSKQRDAVQKPTRRSPSRAAKEAPGQSKVQTQDVCRPKVEPPAPAPRLCHMVRSEKGYGFNLHSTRLRPGQYIRSFDPGSPADVAGLRRQDRVIEVNGVNIESMKHSDVVAFIKAGGDETWMLVVDPETDQHFKSRGVIPTSSHVRDYEGPPIRNGSISTQMNGSSTTRSTRSTRSTISGNSTQLADDEGGPLDDPFAEMGLSATAAEVKMKIHSKEKKKAPQMDWNKKHQLFSNF
ncbi:Na(+)/H(+) exchange regulatory cofactor NHE-RF2 isoform X1 [Nelusetta ayraudi]|uniref:Na(+)/H(+) exchange regulatory cofactor NHE-RF2 isoform X1 n=1 Tax=Nelusetta ayraudi TaxID=303726 RepID=UPI003F71F6A0